MTKKTKPNCLKCRFFRVSWDPHFPRACTLFGFKGRAMPCDTVYEATGAPCEHFAEKTPKKQKE